MSNITRHQEFLHWVLFAEIHKQDLHHTEHSVWLLDWESISFVESLGWCQSKTFKSNLLSPYDVKFRCDLIRQIISGMSRLLAFTKPKEKDLWLVSEISLMYSNPLAWCSQVSWFRAFIILLPKNVPKTVFLLGYSICVCLILVIPAMITHILF